MKAGPITAGAQPKVTVPVKETTSVPAQTVQVVQVKDKPKRSNALGDLGIEFGPASPNQGGTAPGPRKEPPPPVRIPVIDRSRTPDKPTAKTFSLNEVMQKGENVPFNKRKEKKSVDLESLRESLNQALKKTPASAQGSGEAKEEKQSSSSEGADK